MNFTCHSGMHLIAKTHTHSNNITTTAEVEKQLRDGVNPVEVKLFLRLTPRI